MLRKLVKLVSNEILGMGKLRSSELLLYFTHQKYFLLNILINNCVE